jgi:hypothetical protein
MNDFGNQPTARGLLSHTLRGRRGSVRWVLAGVAAVLMLLIPSSSALAASPTSSSAPSTQVVTRRQAVDQATCSQLLAGLKAGASMLSAVNRAALPTLKTTDCTIVSTDTTVPSPLLAAAAAAAATACNDFNHHVGGAIGPIVFWNANVHARMCWNGSAAWVDYMECGLSALLPYGTDITWCGVYHNGLWETNPGLDGDLYVWSTPWNKNAHPWMRYRVFGNGTDSMPWGGQ